MQEVSTNSVSHVSATPSLSMCPYMYVPFSLSHTHTLSLCMSIYSSLLHTRTSVCNGNLDRGAGAQTHARGVNPSVSH